MIRRWLALTYYFAPCGSPPCLIFILIHYIARRPWIERPFIMVNI